LLIHLLWLLPAVQMKAHLEAHILPAGVHAYPVQRVNWLHGTIVCPDGSILEIGQGGNRTDYVLVLPEGLKMLEDMEAAEIPLCSDHMK
jgi:hypothetical protein